MNTTNSDQAKLAAEAPSWTYHENALEKIFVFQTFSEAFGFITRVALLSERMDHHPEWSNIYNEVHIRLSTHTEGDITDKDIVLAHRIDAMVEEV